MFKTLKKAYLALCFFTFCLIVTVDIISLEYTLFGRLGTILWFFSYILLGIYVLKCGKEVMKAFLKKQAVFTTFLLVFFFILIDFNASKPNNLSHETTQETGCALSYLEKGEDLGFRKTCLFGYPARQYFLPSTPSLFWGRTLRALNLGGSLYFIFGIIIFSSGVLKLYENKRIGDLVNAFLLSSIFHFHFVNHFLFFYFEQSIYPFSFGLIITGLFMHFMENKKDLVNIILSGFLLLYLIFSYTPSLSLYFLAIWVMAFFLFDKKLKKEPKMLIAFIIIFSLISFLISFSFRGDIQLFDFNKKSISLLFEDVFSGISHLAFQKQSEVFVSSFYHPIFISFIISALFFIFGWRYAFFSFWMIMVFFVAVITKGYIYYAIPFRFHRAIVSIPVFLAMLAFIFRRLNIKEKHLFIPVILVFLFGFSFQRDYLSSREPVYQLPNVLWLKENIPLEKQENRKKYIYLIGEEFVDLEILNDFFPYFAPHFQDGGYRNELIDEGCQVRSDNSGILILRITHICYKELLSQSKDLSNLYYYGTIRSRRDGNLGVFEFGSKPDSF